MRRWTCASLAPVAAKTDRALLMRSPEDVSYMVLLTMVAAEIAVEYGHEDGNRRLDGEPDPQKATHAASSSFLASTGFEV